MTDAAFQSAPADPASNSGANPDADRDAAAILLMLLAEDDAAAVVSRLDPQAIETIGAAMYALDRVDESRVSRALDRFVRSVRAASPVSDDPAGHITGMVRRALEPARADELIGRIVPVTAQDPLPSLKWLSDADLVALAGAEHPQMVALITAHLPPERAAAMIAALGDDDQADILFRAATLGPVSAEALADADAILLDALGKGRASGGGDSGGPAAIAAILNHTAKPLETRLLKALAKRDKALAAQIEADMVIFDDILALPDKALGSVARGVDSADLALALRGVDTAFVDRVLATMSSRAADTMRDAMAEQGPVPMAEVQGAQRRVIATARALADDGVIQLGNGGANDLV